PRRRRHLPGTAHAAAPRGARPLVGGNVRLPDRAGRARPAAARRGLAAALAASGRERRDSRDGWLRAHLPARRPRIAPRPGPTLCEVRVAAPAAGVGLTRRAPWPTSCSTRTW